MWKNPSPFCLRDFQLHIKVHLFLKQCLCNLLFTQKKVPFKLTSADIS